MATTQGGWRCGAGRQAPWDRKMRRVDGRDRAAERRGIAASASLSRKGGPSQIRGRGHPPRGAGIGGHRLVITHSHSYRMGRHVPTDRPAARLPPQETRNGPTGRRIGAADPNRHRTSCYITSDGSEDRMSPRRPGMTWRGLGARGFHEDVDANVNSRWRRAAIRDMPLSPLTSRQMSWTKAEKSKLYLGL